MIIPSAHKNPWKQVFFLVSKGFTFLIFYLLIPHQYLCETIALTIPAETTEVFLTWF